MSYRYILTKFSHKGASRSYFKLCLILISVLWNASSLQAQNSGIKGVIVDEGGAAMPYANVIVLGQSIGTSTNFDGEFNLPLRPGAYKISFQFVGYKTKVVELEVKAGTFEFLNIELAEEQLMMDAVIVRPNGENPAHRIIRGAQAKKQQYENENKNLGYMAYTKLFGKSKENSIKQIGFFGTQLEPAKGIFYLSESVLDIYQYDRKNTTEILDASIIMDDSAGYSKNYSNFIEFYQDNPMSVYSGVVTNRMISPIAKEAFAYYEYELKGSIEVNDELIHKIEVFPKVNNGICFAGDIYIIDKSWRLYEAQLTLDNSLLGKFEISTTYIEDAAHNTWLPFTCNINLTEGDDELVVIYHNIFYDFNFEKEAPPFDKQANYVIGDQNLSRDSAWWANTRPIALTEDEKKAYFSQRVEAEVSNQADSVPADNEFASSKSKAMQGRKILNAMRTGEYELNKHLSVKTNLFTFNTIEGGVLTPGLVYNTTTTKDKILSLGVDMRYGFASNTFYGKSVIDYELDPAKLTSLQLGAGSYVEEITGGESISPYFNMVYSLLEQNLQKLYQRNFAEAAIQTELLNGLDIAVSSSYAVRYPLENNTTYNWADEEDYLFTPNAALIAGEYQNFDRSNLWESGLLLRYQHNRSLT